jgi:hypothetical protein
VLTADIVFVNSIAFLTTLSQKLRLRRVEQLPTRKAKQLNSSLTKIVRLYAWMGFIVRVVMMDWNFDKIEDETDMVEINTTAARGHVGKLELFIRTIKEQSQALMSDLPFEVLPCQVIIHQESFVVLWLNSLPVAAGVSEQYSCRGFRTIPPLRCCPG